MRALTPMLLAVLLTVAGLAWARPEFFWAEKATTHFIVFQSREDPSHWKFCSATAVAADTLRTARHCVDGIKHKDGTFEDFSLAMVDGDEVEPYGTRMLPGDMAEVVLTKELFTHWAMLGPHPEQGDRVHWWGNPSGARPRTLMPDMYREGVVAHVTDKLVVIDAMVCHGDSGAGLFNEAGQLVGVVIEKGPDYESGCAFAIGQL